MVRKAQWNLIYFFSAALPIFGPYNSIALIISRLTDVAPICRSVLWRKFHYGSYIRIVNEYRSSGILSNASRRCILIKTEILFMSACDSKFNLYPWNYYFLSGKSQTHRLLSNYTEKIKVLLDNTFEWVLYLKQKLRVSEYDAAGLYCFFRDRFSRSSLIKQPEHMVAEDWILFWISMRIYSIYFVSTSMKPNLAQKNCKYILLTGPHEEWAGKGWQIGIKDNTDMLSWIWFRHLRDLFILSNLSYYNYTIDWEHDGPKKVSRAVGQHLYNRDLMRSLSRQTSTVQRRVAIIKVHYFQPR